MGDKQSGHNDISPTKLNSIHHKVVINTNRVERTDSTDYNTSCNCEMRWDGDEDGADVGDDVDDDLDDARDDDDDDGDDLPFREVISPAESARRRWLFSSVGFRPVAAAKHGKFSISRVSTPGGFIGERGHRGGPPGIQEGACRGQEGGRARHPSGCLVGPLTSIFGDPQSFFIKVLPVNFHRIWT